MADERERFTLTGGYQKTWHRWDADRDLIVAKARYLPHDGWDVSSAGNSSEKRAQSSLRSLVRISSRMGPGRGVSRSVVNQWSGGFFPRE